MIIHSLCVSYSHTSGVIYQSKKQPEQQRDHHTIASNNIQLKTYYPVQSGIETGKTMNLNSMMFVPSMNNTPTGTAAAAAQAANMMMSSGAGTHFMSGPPPPHHHSHSHPHANASAMYHMRQMAAAANYHQQTRFMGPPPHPSQQSPPQRSGFSYYNQGPRHYYNATMMNQQRLPGPSANYNPTMWSNKLGAVAQKPLANLKEKEPSSISSTTNDTTNKITDSSNASTGEHIHNTNNNKPPAVAAPISSNKQQQHQSKKSYEKHDKVKLTKLPKMKRSDSKSSIKSSTTLVVAAVATVTAAAATSDSTTAASQHCVKVSNKDMKQREQQKKKSKYIL